MAEAYAIIREIFNMKEDFSKEKDKVLELFMPMDNLFTVGIGLMVL